MTNRDESVATAEAGVQETRERILDAAETLFAVHGFHGASLRQITSEAGVNLAAVNYHFGTREALVAEVVGRVLDPINRERLRLLDEAEARTRDEGRELTAEEILQAALRPVVLDLPRSREENARFLKLAGQCLNEKAEQIPETLQQVFRQVMERFAAALGKALPRLDEAEIHWRLHFVAGALLYTLMQQDRLSLMSRGSVEAVDPEETMARLIAFTTGGMEAAPSRTPARADCGGSRLGAALPSLAAALALLGASCAATAPPDARQSADLGEIPDKWKAAPAEAATAAPAVDPKAPRGGSMPLADRGWVSGFRDKRLDDLVAAALENNKDLAAAAARVEIAEANARIAGADLYPQGGGVFRSSRQKRNFIGFPIGDPAAEGDEAGGVFSSLNNEHSLALDMSWEIDLWGRIRAGQSAMISERQASAAERAAAELSLAGQVAKAWFALQEARLQADLAESTVETFQRTETAVRDRFEAGVDEGGQGLASQLRLAMVDIETARDLLEQRREQAEQGARQIELLLGRYPSAALNGGSGLPALPPPPPAGMPGDLLDRRPDLHAAERRLAAADQRVLEAKRALLPAITLTGSAGTSSEQISDLLRRDFSIWSLAGGAAQPLLTGGRLKAGIRLKQAEIKQAAAQFEQAALSAFGEVEAALSGGRYLARRQASLEKAAALAEEAYLRASEEFTDGTGDILTMLAAQERLFRQRSQLIAVKRQRLDNRVDLHLALGGGFHRGA